MITEDYCSYEISRLLEEKGFDIPCKYAWHGGIKKPDFHRHSRNFNGGEYKDLRTKWYSAPTHQMAMKWLREAHGLFIQIGYYEDWADDADGKKVDSWNYWGIDIFYLPSGLRVDPEITDQYDTYKEAVEAAIKYSLENLI